MCPGDVDDGPSQPGDARGKKGPLEQVQSRFKKELEGLEGKFRALKKKMTRGVLDGIEKLEQARYEHERRVDAFTEKLDQDWRHFEREFSSTIENWKKQSKENTEKVLEDLQARKEVMQKQIAAWEQNYDEWTRSTRKSLKNSWDAWQRAGWMFYVKFLVVVIPIVIIIVVLASVFQ